MNGLIAERMFTMLDETGQTNEIIVRIAGPQQTDLGFACRFQIRESPAGKTRNEQSTASKPSKLCRCASGFSQ